MESIIESLEKIDIKLDNEYNLPKEHIITDLKTLYEIYNDLSQQDEPRFKEKLKEIEEIILILWFLKKRKMRK